MVAILLVLLLLMAIWVSTVAYGMSATDPTTPPPLLSGSPQTSCPTQPPPVVIRIPADPRPVDKKYIGCFASFGNPGRDLDTLLPAPVNSLDECAMLAKDKNYRYFTVVDGTCKGSNHLGFVNEPLTDDECMWSCDGSVKTDTLSCGVNKNVLSVFENGHYVKSSPTIPSGTAIPYEYKGCYVDDVNNRSLSHLLSASVTSPESCARLAQEAGMKYFGLQNYGQCWGGSSMFDASRYGLRNDDSACRWKCDPLNPERTADVSCGIELTNAVYENKLID